MLAFLTGRFARRRAGVNEERERSFGGKSIIVYKFRYISLDWLSLNVLETKAKGSQICE